MRLLSISELFACTTSRFAWVAQTSPNLREQIKQLGSPDGREEVTAEDAFYRMDRNTDR